MSELVASFSEEKPLNASLASTDKKLAASAGEIVFGLAGTVEVGTVVEGDKAAVTNSGTKQNAVLNFVLPRGPEGPAPEKGKDYWTAEDKEEIIQEVVDQVGQVKPYEIGHGLKLDEASNTLSVDTAEQVEEDNTLPITSAAVYATVGNIETLLGTI